MGGFFGAISKRDCVLDIFFGADYHSHLGSRRGGMAFYDEERGFQRQIHNIENTPFRTKFEGDLGKFSGCSGIGSISDTDPQPLLVRSHLGLYAIAFVGVIHNDDALIEPGAIVRHAILGENSKVCRNAVVGGAFEKNEAKEISVTSKGAVVEANTVLLPGEML